MISTLCVRISETNDNKNRKKKKTQKLKSTRIDLKKLWGFSEFGAISRFIRPEQWLLTTDPPTFLSEIAY